MLTEVERIAELEASLEAAQQEYQIACDLVEQTEAERDAARDDLAGVEAERDALFKELTHADRDISDDAMVGHILAREVRSAQARITELQGSLRPFAEAARKIDSWGVEVDDDLDLILLDESEVGLTVSDLREARAVLEPQTPAAS